MARARALALGIVVIGGALVSALGSACEVFTRETCNAAGVNALGDPKGPACKECMERAATCDTVGYCNDVAGCQEEVKRAHACVLDAGKLATQREDGCIAGLSPAANSTYQQMRSSCGNECDLPVCKVDQATVRFGAAACDKCITGACCSEINRCYANRTCKLILECIVRCPDALTPGRIELAALAGRGPCDVHDDGDLARPPVGAPDGGDGGAGSCVQDCIFAFRLHEQKRTEDPKASPECLAYAIRSCALDVGCTRDCDGGLAP